MTDQNQPASLETHLAYCAQGKEIIERKLATALAADPSDAPFPLVGEEAALWHQAQASAYQHALEMMAPAGKDISEEMLQRSIDTIKKVLDRQAKRETVA